MSAPLSRTEFADALRKGKGRVVQHVRTHGDAGVEDLLLEACLHCQSHDPQSEGYRSDWLMGMLAMLPDPQPYYDAVLAAFATTTNGRDAQQMAGMLAALAEDGRPAARAALYEKFDRQEFPEDWMISLRLIALDGLEGLLYVARVLGRRLGSDPDFWLDGYLSQVAREQLGAEAVDEALRVAATNDADIERFQTAEAATEQLSARDERPYRLADFLRELDERNKKPGIIAHRFSRSASGDELNALLELIERESDSDRLATMLAVFRQRADPPGGPERILPFARSPNAAVRRAAIAVLAKFADARVVELSVELLAAGKLEGLSLLERSFVTGQFGQVRSLLPVAADDDAAHRIVLDIIGICGPQLDSEAAGCLLWVYERSPCSFCRQSAVNDLIKLGRLPETLATECLDDCMSEVREAVAAAR